MFEGIWGEVRSVSPVHYTINHFISQDNMYNFGDQVAPAAERIFGDALLNLSKLIIGWGLNIMHKKNQKFRKISRGLCKMNAVSFFYI